MTADLNAILPEIGETVIYTAKGEDPITITAVIERGNDSRIVEAQMGITNSATVLVSMSDVPTVVRDADTITFPMIYGGSAEAFTVRNILSQDASHWKLMVS